MSQENLKTQEHVTNDTNSVILRLERSQPVKETEDTSSALAFYASHDTQITQMISILGLFSRSKLTNNSRSWSAKPKGSCATTMGAQNLYTTIMLHSLSILYPTN